MHMLQMNPMLIIQILYKNFHESHNFEYRYPIIYHLLTVMGKPQKW